MNSTSRFLCLVLCCFSLSAGAAEAITLQQAYQAAIAHSEQVQISAEEINKSASMISQATGHITPRVSLKASETLQDKAPSAGSGSAVSSTFTRQSRPEVALNLTQPIFHGLKDFQAISAFKAQKQANQASLENAKRELFLDVADFYTQIIKLETQQETTKKILTVLKKELGDLKTREQIGKIRTSERVREEAQIATLEATLSQIDGNLLVAREGLTFLTGLNNTTTLDKTPLAATSIEPLQTYLDKLEKRPDLIAASENAKSKQALVRYEKADLFPQIDFDANYYPYRVGYLSDIKWDAAFKLNLTLTPLTELGEIRLAKANAHEENLKLSESRRQAENEIKQSYAKAQSAIEQNKAFEKAARLSERAYALQKEDRNLGLIKESDVFTAESNWMNALLSADEARLNVLQSMIDLQLKSGTL